MKFKRFTIKDNKLLCWRLGPINSQKQKHFSKDVEYLGMGGTNKPPISRGMWAFPYPHYDYFFAWHQVEKFYPKKYLDVIHGDIKIQGDVDEFWKGFSEIDKKCFHLRKPSLFYAGEFYSRIRPKGHAIINGYNWYYWDNPTEWAKEANKLLIKFFKTDSGILRFWSMPKDHLELFIP